MDISLLFTFNTLDEFQESSQDVLVEEHLMNAAWSLSKQAELIATEFNIKTVAKIFFQHCDAPLK